MEYEEKLSKYRAGKPIFLNDLESIDYFRFARDRALKQVRFSTSGKENLYEVHCKEVNSNNYKSFLDDVFWVRDRCNDSEKPFSDFIKLLLKNRNLSKHMYLDTKFYLVELDPLETWE